MSWKKKKIYIYCPGHSSLGIALRHLRVSITDHNSLLETNSWGKAAGWKRLDCFTFQTIVPGWFVSIFSPLWDAGSSQGAAGALPLPPSHTHVPSAPSRGALAVGWAGKFWGLDHVGGLSLLSPAPGDIIQPAELTGLPLAPAVIGWRIAHGDTRLFPGNTDAPVPPWNVCIFW